MGIDERNNLGTTVALKTIKVKYCWFPFLQLAACALNRVSIISFH